MSAWTILTCEYPPECGGVGSYTAQIADALAASGDEVTVFCPPPLQPLPSPAQVRVVELEDAYGRRSRAAVDRHQSAGGATVLVQYVPTAFGMGGANLPFCHWLLGRARGFGDDIRVMFHEPYFEYGWQPLHQTPLSLAQRAMARVLLRASRATYLSTDAWRRYLSPYVRGAALDRFVTIPIPSSIPRLTDVERDRARARRAEITGDRRGPVAGHFGTYGSQIAPSLRHALVALLGSDPDLTAVCIGAGSDVFVGETMAIVPGLERRLHATARLAAADVAAWLGACDLLLQPYPDGVTTRRTSVMAGLINRVPVLTTTGHLTESIWSATGAVEMTAAGDAQGFVDAARQLLQDGAGRDSLGRRGEAVYAQHFAIEHTIEALRQPAGGAAS
jgi:glycosyltransferase involved in cell wall biosynthesis